MVKILRCACGAGVLGQRVYFNQQTLLHFDLSAIPQGSQLISARLELYQTNASGFERYAIWPDMLTKSWRELSVTWDSKPTATVVGSLSQLVDLVAGLKSWDVVDIVDRWMSGKDPNYGLLLRGDGDTVGLHEFDARDAKNPPRLVIEYLAPTATPTATTAPCSGLSSPDQIPSPGLINFDDLPGTTVIGTAYQAAHGVTFENSGITRALIYANEPAEAHTSPNVAINDAVSPGTSAGVPMKIEFNAAKQYVVSYLGNGDTLKPVAHIMAYDVTGALICEIRVPDVPEEHTLFSGFHDPAGRIRTLMIDYGNTSLNESIDDLYYAPAGPGPTPTPTYTPSITPTPSRTPTPTVTHTPTRNGHSHAHADADAHAQHRPGGGPARSDAGGAGPQQQRAPGEEQAHLCALPRALDERRPSHLRHAAGATRGGSSTVLFPINSGTVSVRTSPDRGTAQPLLPVRAALGLPEGTVSLTAYLNPLIALRPARTAIRWRPTTATTRVSTTVSFETVPDVDLVIYRVGYKRGRAPPTIRRPPHRDQLIDWLERAYPAQTIWMCGYRTIYYGTGAVNGDGDLTTPNCGTGQLDAVGQKDLGLHHLLRRSPGMRTTTAW